MPIPIGVARSAEWLWGTREEAAEALGISERQLSRARRGLRVSDEADVAFSRRWAGLSPGYRHALQHGEEMTRSLSPKQRDVLRAEFKGVPRFKGRKFSRAVRQFTRQREEIPDDIGDYLDDVYE